jgi:hypothetical protein
MKLTAEKRIQSNKINSSTSYIRVPELTGWLFNTDENEKLTTISKRLDV